MPAVGVDITPQHSVLVELGRNGMSFRVTRAAILSGYDHEPNRDATSAKGSAFARALESVPGALRNRGALVSMPSAEVMFRTTDIGSGTSAAIKALINMEVEELTGGKTPMVNGYQLLEGGRGGPKALIGVTREALVNHYATALRSTGLNVHGFSPASIALYQCYLTSGSIDGDSATMVVNIGDGSTDVCVINGADLVAVRSLMYGVRDFVTALSSALGVNAEQARETLTQRINIRPGYAKQNVTGERAVAAAQDSASRLFQQLDGCIRYARATSGNPGLKVGKVLICGVGATIQGLPQFLDSRFAGSSVELFNPLSGFDLSSLDDTSRETVTHFAPAMAVALGLARIQLETGINALTFQPPALVARRNFMQRSIWLYAAVLLLVVSLAAGLMLSMQMKGTLTELDQKVSSEVRPYAAPHGKLSSRSNTSAAAALNDPLAGLSSARRSNEIQRQRLIELSDARLPGVQAMRLLSSLAQDQERMPQVQFTGFDLKLKTDIVKIKDERGRESESFEKFETRVIVNAFFRSGTKTKQQLQTEVRDLIKKNVSVSEVSLGDLTEEIDGSGTSTFFTVTLKTTDDLLSNRAEGVAQ